MRAKMGKNGGNGGKVDGWMGGCEEGGWGEWGEGEGGRGEGKRRGGGRGGMGEGEKTGGGEFSQSAEKPDVSAEWRAQSSDSSPVKRVLGSKGEKATTASRK